jgi:hypothetical protein
MASSENLTIKTRNAGAGARVRERARVCVRVRVCAYVCAYISPPLSDFEAPFEKDPPIKKLTPGEKI